MARLSLFEISSSKPLLGSVYVETFDFAHNSPYLGIPECDADISNPVQDITVHYFLQEDFCTGTYVPYVRYRYLCMYMYLKRNS